ncbi:hypothetical protein M0804_006995 [Polistes exclamans]|nr:hypothetical protein M0804_006995 [Polistes exclamans]
MGDDDKDGGDVRGSGGNGMGIIATAKDQEVYEITETKHIGAHFYIRSSTLDDRLKPLYVSVLFDICLATALFIKI